MSSSRRSARHDAVQRPVTELARILHDKTGADVDEELLQRGLVHRSYSYENGGVPHNERQEFLGDAILGLVVTDHLYHAHPDLPEGQLAKFRAAVVNSRALAAVAREIDLGSFVLLGKGELSSGGRDKDSILADTMESVIGTVYLCGGVAAAARLIHDLMDGRIDASAELGAGLDWKTSLQEVASAAGLGSPHYTVQEQGPDHDKVFTATVLVVGEPVGTGIGRNKKSAEQLAAEQAWRRLKEHTGTGA
ncbi:ribonuclease III [Allobranchiibius huperziae]|uniref:Ribonuclease 3 n=1 Tax=Allobranchiibius huperziae TaxID=1874116 RepID=A0A853DAT4_9MICO|nr:ribonuclease-3 [Allobranchiibius huperziae]